MKTTWSISDSIDLEYFAALDRDIPYQTLRERDRRIAEEYPGAAKERMLFSWLTARRRDSGRAAPGQVFASIVTGVRLFLIVFGLICGFIAGWGFFSYLGHTPINVLYFFVAFILPQWLFLLLTVLALLPGHGSSLYPPLQLATALLRHLYTAAWKKLVNRLDAGKRLRLDALAGQGQLFAGRLGKVFFWRVAALTQAFACVVNIGLLASSLLKIAVTDLAFGWQSTLTFSAERLFAAVRLLAAPWSWLWPEGIAYPSLAQIGGSRIVLKEGIVRLQTEDLLSWWPFLLLCLIVYGLLPRLILWMFCRWRERRALAASLSGMPEADEVWQRMKRPVVTTRGLPDAGGDTAIAISPVSAAFPARSASQRQEAPTRPLLLLVPEELQPSLPEKVLESCLAGYGLRLAAIRPIPNEYEARLALPTAVAAEMNALAAPDSPSTLCLLAESWLPPIESFLELLRRLRSAIGVEKRIFVLLIGKVKDGGMALAPPDDPVMMTVWRQKLAALADPALRPLSFDQEES